MFCLLSLIPTLFRYNVCYSSVSSIRNTSPVTVTNLPFSTVSTGNVTNIPAPVIISRLTITSIMTRYSTHRANSFLLFILSFILLMIFRIIFSISSLISAQSPHCADNLPHCHDDLSAPRRLHGTVLAPLRQAVSQSVLPLPAAVPLMLYPESHTPR